MDQISMVFQSVCLFADTIENNIEFGCPNATHDKTILMIVLQFRISAALIRFWRSTAVKPSSRAREELIRQSGIYADFVGGNRDEITGWKL